MKLYNRVLTLDEYYDIIAGLGYRSHNLKTYDCSDIIEAVESDIELDIHPWFSGLCLVVDYLGGLLFEELPLEYEEGVFFDHSLEEGMWGLACYILDYDIKSRDLTPLVDNLNEVLNYDGNFIECNICHRLTPNGYTNDDGDYYCSELCILADYPDYLITKIALENESLSAEDAPDKIWYNDFDDEETQPLVYGMYYTSFMDY